MTADGLIPQGLVDRVRQHVPDPGMPAGATWLDQLPRLLSGLLEQWRLRIDGPSRHGYAALVVPVLTEDDRSAVLKVVWPHVEGVDEHRTLGLWAGNGAVRMLATDRTRWALLLERLDADHDLGSVEVLEGCTRIGELLARLDRPAPPWARLLSDHLANLVVDIDRVLDEPGSADLFPRRFLQQGRTLARELAVTAEVDSRLLHTDLHQENVLWRPDPGEWVAIDPQTMAADPAFGVTPALWNEWDAALRAPDLGDHLNQRLHALVDASGVDPDRARAYSIVRLVRNALWDLAAPGPDLVADMTRTVTLLKALQPG